MAHSFEIEGIRFELDHLNVDDACAGLETLGKILGPALADGSLQPLALVAQASYAPALLKLFGPVCKVSRNRDGTFPNGELMVPVKDFGKDVFRGRVDLLMSFLFQCVQFEYATFLAALDGLGAAAQTQQTQTP